MQSKSLKFKSKKCGKVVEANLNRIVTFFLLRGNISNTTLAKGAKAWIVLRYYSTLLFYFRPLLYIFSIRKVLKT